MSGKPNADIILISAKNATMPPDPFSHTTLVGPWVHTSDMGGSLPATGELISADVIEQTKQSYPRNRRLYIVGRGKINIKLD